ncbi:tetratricopeptide repeat protein [Fulvivirga lutimaris]|uniref:tetratricopeptide repeat protein n=1 Tax=Fulvivirga lutimaris TaxID=1819566 RepID=UPI0012BC3B33|nr:tetratricopeptide repeat protein [Fulvivirga lutimaris]MTI38671.1 tetratricopeptide repeat protein [Fulvivirga lutimaris]
MGLNLIFTLLIFVFAVNGKPSVNLVKKPDQAETQNQQIAKLLDSLDYYWHSDTQMAILYADSAYQIANDLNLNNTQKVDVLANKGIAEYTKGNYNEALIYYDSAIYLGTSLDKDVSLVFIYTLNLLRKQGRFKEVIFRVDSLLDLSGISQSRRDELLLVKAKVIAQSGNAQSAFETLKVIDFDNLPIEQQASYIVIQSTLENIKGEYASAIKHLDKSLSIYQYRGDSLSMAEVNLEKAKIYMNYGGFDSASIAINKGLEIYKRAKYPYGIAKTYFLLGSVYTEMGKGEMAVDYYYKALKTFEDQSNIKEIAETYADLAWLYSAQDSEKSLELINKSINLAHRIGDIGVEATGYNYKGVFFDRMNQYDSAIWCYDKSFRLRTSINYEKGAVAAEFNKGFVYEKMGMYAKALEIYQRTYPIELELGNALGSAISEYTIGGLYIKLKNYREAKKYLDLANKHLTEMDALSYLLECLDLYVKYYEAIGDDTKALEYFKQHAALKDSVNSREKDVRLAELESRYKLEKREKELTLLSLENENRKQSQDLQNKTITNQRIFIGFISTGILSVVILLIITFRILQIKSRNNKRLEALNKEISEQAEEITAQSEELQEANEEIVSLNEGLEYKIDERTKELREAHKELDTFFYHASHDFRRPLTTFLGLAEIASTILTDPKALELFDKVKDTAGSLDRMVSKLKAISIIGFDKLKYTEVNLEGLLNRVIDKHQKLKKDNLLSFKFDLKVKEVYSSYDLLEIIMDNLIENAILYKKKATDSWISIETNKMDGHVIFKVSDNGQGIEKELTDRIFEMYFRANELSQGNGLGLYITKKAVSKLDGFIEFETKHDEGSTFTIHIPVIV